MAKKGTINTNVTVTDPSGRSVTFTPQDELPDWFYEVCTPETNPNVWGEVGAEVPAAAPTETAKAKPAEADADAGTPSRSKTK